MEKLFVVAFYGLFAALSVAYVIRQRRHARLVWAPVYVLSVLALTYLMFEARRLLAKIQVILEVGHASTLLVLVFFSWLLLAGLVVVATWLTLPRKDKI